MGVLATVRSGPLAARLGAADRRALSTTASPSPVSLLLVADPGGHLFGEPPACGTSGVDSRERG